MQKRAAGPVDGPGVIAIQRQNITCAARGFVEVDVRQAFPTAPDSDDVTIDFTSSIDDALDH